MLNSAQIAAVVRWFLTFVGGIAVSHGLLSDEDMAGLSAAVLAWIGPTMTLAVLAWSIWRHSRSVTVAAAAKLPEVKQITTTPLLARAVVQAASGDAEVSRKVTS